MPEQPEQESKILQEGLQKLIFENSEVKSSLGEIIIVSTEDKISLSLIRHLRRIGEKRSWITPASLLLTVVITFLTTEFKNRVFDRETWQAVFLIAGAIFFGWFIRVLPWAFKSATESDVLKEIKKNSLTKAVNEIKK